MEENECQLDYKACSISESSFREEKKTQSNVNDY